MLAVLLAAQLTMPAPRADAPQPPPADGSIRGRVVAGDTGQPLRNAEIQLFQVDAPTPARPNRENRAASTGADGTYEFANLPPGRYNVSASKRAYVRLLWGQDQANPAGKPLDLAAAERIERVDFVLPRGGVITGRIVDESGEPIQGLRVNAVRPRAANGYRRPTAGLGSASTDDLGEFRIFGLEPGQYVVRAIWQRVGPGDPNSIDRTGYAPTFFPGTGNEAEAQRFTVAAGRAVGDLAMTMPSIKSARVEGSIVDGQGQPVTGVMLEVLSTVGEANSMSAMTPRPDGTFVFASLAPGDYVFRTQATPNRPDVALQKITLAAGDDIKDLRLVTMPPATISGRVIVDPSMPAPTAGFSVMAALDNQMMPGGMRPAKIADDLTFQLTASPGRNRIVTLNLPPGWMMRAVRVDSVDVIDDGIEVVPGQRITNVDIELTTRGASVSGLVLDARGEPLKDYSVVLFPADSKRWKAGSRYLRTARPDRDGRFRVSSLPAADYYIVAVDKLEAGQGGDAEFLERMAPGSKRLTLVEGDVRTIDLRVTTIR